MEPLITSGTVPAESYYREHGLRLLLIAMVAWVANYLHFMAFGLYEDDWFFIAFPYLVTFKQWMLGSLADQFKAPHFQGRPLQMVFGYAFAEAGALANSLAVNYLIAYGLFAGSALLAYEALRRRFGVFLATFTALLFVLTPLHTLHQFLNGQLYSFGPAFIFVFIAFIFYVRQRVGWAYLFAVLSLFCYETIFILFAGAPFLRPGPVFRDRSREWVRHAGVFLAIVALYLGARHLVAEARVSGLPGGASLIQPVLFTAVFQTAASFATYLYGVLRAQEASVEGRVYCVVFLAALFAGFRGYQRFTPAIVERREHTLLNALRAVGIGFVFILLGYALAYFVLLEPTPHFHATDRDTRISVASSFGSSLAVAAFFTGWMGLAGSRLAKAAAYGAASVFLCLMFLYSFVLQQDYVADWQEQRQVAAQMVSLTPDIETDSLIVLQRRVPGIPFFTSGRRRRAIGIEKTLYEYQFSNVHAPPGQPWPRLFVVQSEQWPHYLKADGNGMMRWKAPVFDGRWYPAAVDLPSPAGRFIVLDEVEPGVIVRRSDPIIVEGRQIVQQAMTTNRKPPLWTTVRDTPLLRAYLPDFAWRGLAAAQ